MEPVIYGSKSVCIEISFVSSDFGEANKRTRKYRGDPPEWGETLCGCAADHEEGVLALALPGPLMARGQDNG